VTVGVGEDAFVELFSESAARCLVTVQSGDEAALEAMAGALGTPFRHLGTTGGDALTVDGQLSIPLDELRAAWSSTLPDALGA
jgi:phosphoribosylformylglycinamidine synthase